MSRLPSLLARAGLLLHRPLVAGLLALAALRVGLPGARIGDAQASGEELAPAQRVELRLEVARSTWWAGEVLAIDLVLACDRAWLDAHGVALFRQPASLPLLLRAPGLDLPPGKPGPGGLLRLPDAHDGHDAPRGTPPLRLALGDEVLAAERLPDDPARPGWLRARVRRRFHAPAPVAALALLPPSVEFAHAARFTSDMLGNRVPEQPQRVRSEGAGLVLEVRALPEAGRPASFEGWIGRWRLEPGPRPGTTLAAGEPLRVLLHLVGEGNEAVLPPPRLDAPAGWRLLGLLDGRDARGRVLTLDLLPEPAPSEAGPRALAGLCLSTFDPLAGTYGTACAPRMTVSLAATAAGTPAGSPPESPTPDGTPTPGATSPASAPPPAPAGPRTWLVVLAGLACGAGLALWRLRRGAAAARTAPAADDRAARAADLARATALLEACAAGTPPTPDALREALALWQGCAPAALVTPDLAARLVRSGWAADLAARTAAAVEARVAARYAGPGAAPVAALAAREAELARTLVERLREARGA